MISLKNLAFCAYECAESIEDIFKTSSFLYNNHKFSPSVYYTILGMEEIGKYATYNDHIRKGKNISNNMEKKLSSDHLYKLKKCISLEIIRNDLLKKKLKTSQNLLFNSIPKANIILKETELLDKVKQFSIYYTFKKGKSLNSFHFYEKNKLLKNNFGHYCLILNKMAIYTFDLETLRHKYGDKDGQIFAENVPSNDKLLQRIKKMYEWLASGNISVKKYRNVNLELMKLVKQLD